MRLTKLKRKIKKALAASARANYDQKCKGNKANTCVDNFLHSQHPRNLTKKKITNAAHNINNINGNICKLYSTVIAGSPESFRDITSRFAGTTQAQFMNGPPHFRTTRFYYDLAHQAFFVGEQLYNFAKTPLRTGNRIVHEENNIFKWTSS